MSLSEQDLGRFPLFQAPPFAPELARAYGHNIRYLTPDERVAARAAEGPVVETIDTLLEEKPKDTRADKKGDPLNLEKLDKEEPKGFHLLVDRHWDWGLSHSSTTFLFHSEGGVIVRKSYTHSSGNTEFPSHTPGALHEASADELNELLATIQTSTPRVIPQG